MNNNGDWIPVSEGLPEDEHEIVLVTYECVCEDGTKERRVARCVYSVFYGTLGDMCEGLKGKHWIDWEACRELSDEVAFMMDFDEEVDACVLDAGKNPVKVLAWMHMPSAYEGE